MGGARRLAMRTMDIFRFYSGCHSTQFGLSALILSFQYPILILCNICLLRESMWWSWICIFWHDLPQKCVSDRYDLWLGPSRFWNVNGMNVSHIMASAPLIVGPRNSCESLEESPSSTSLPPSVSCLDYWTVWPMPVTFIKGALRPRSWRPTCRQHCHAVPHSDDDSVEIQFSGGYACVVNASFGYDYKRSN